MMDQANVGPRVLVVSLGRRGGVTRYGFLMAKGLSEHARVASITALGAENRDRWRELDGPHLEIGTFSSVATMLASFFAVGRFLAMRRFAREFAPDVIYYPGGHAYKPVLDFLLPTTAITILTVHDPQLHPGEDSLAQRVFGAANLRKNDGYVLLNEAQRADFAAQHGVGPSRVKVIVHGVFDDTLDAARPLGDVTGLEPIALHAGRYALLVGRIERYKGIDTLLEAYRSLPQGASFPLVIAGAGEFSADELSRIEELADRPVFIVNRWLSDRELASLVAAARFVVVPYVSATQSGVIATASAFGIPVIASDAGGLAEQVVEGETGLLFSAGDSAALAVALLKAFSMDDAAHAEMSQKAREYAKSEWAWDVLARRLVDFSESLKHLA